MLGALFFRPNSSRPVSVGWLRRAGIVTLCLTGACDEPAVALQQAPAPISPLATDGAPESGSEPSPLSRAAPVHLPPRVRLDGVAEGLSHVSLGTGPRIHALSLRTWIYQRPDRNSQKLGYLRAGSSVESSEGPVGHARCKGGWYEVQPAGYVCLDKRATQDGKHPIVQLTREHPPRSDQRLPYRYGTVRRPGPVYQKLPSQAELLQAEPDFETRFPRWLTAGGEIGASFRPEVWHFGERPTDAKQAHEARLSEGVPPWLQLGKRLPSALGRPRPRTVVLDRSKPHVGYSFLHTLFHEGRRYGLTPQLELVPTDRLRPIVGSAHRGVEIGKDVQLPFAYVRVVGAKFANGEKVPYRSVLALSGKKKFINKRLHYETETGHYISDLVASEVRLARRMPAWAKRGEKWISVSISKQVLVLYEGQTPVFATLVSSGEDGLAPAESSTATKRGWFRIFAKHVTATMASDEVGEEFELRDVPYVQYFAEGGYALHGAYWHDRFGTPKSHGCINLSPEDARRIFSWTEPQVPIGWHGANSAKKGTIIFVHP